MINEITYEKQPLKEFVKNFDMVDRTIFLHLMKIANCKVSTNDVDLNLAFATLYAKIPKPELVNNEINNCIDYTGYAQELLNLFTRNEKHDIFFINKDKIEIIIRTQNLDVNSYKILHTFNFFNLSPIVYIYEPVHLQAFSLSDFETNTDSDSINKKKIESEMMIVENLLNITNDKKLKRLSSDNIELFRHFLYYLVQRLQRGYVQNNCYSEAVYATFWGDRAPHSIDDGGKTTASWGTLKIEDIIFYLVDRYKTNSIEAEYEKVIPDLINRGYTQTSAKANVIGEKFNIDELSAALSTLITLSVKEYKDDINDNNPLIEYVGGLEEDENYKLGYTIRLLLHRPTRGIGDEDFVVSAFVDYPKPKRTPTEINNLIKNQNEFVESHFRGTKISPKKDGADKDSICAKSYHEIERIVGTSWMARKDRAKMNGIYTRVLIYNINRLIDRYINNNKLPYFVQEPYSPGLKYGNKTT